MSDFILVVVDTAKIQPYIFGSNRLRENVGASHLVHLATGGWLKSEPETLLPSNHNIVEGTLHNNNGAGIEAGAFDAEVLYAGGGNTAILFRDESQATAFARKLSERVLCEAPGLDVVIWQQAFAWQDSLAVALDAAFKQLGKKKREREFSHPLLGLGVTAACRSTGLPANTERRPPGEADFIPLSYTALAKWEQNEPAKQRLRRELLHLSDDRSAFAADFDFPNDFDYLGRALGEQSYIAVVHADGNGMGKLFDRLNEAYRTWSGDGNRAYITKLRDLSEQVNSLGLNALREVVRKVWEWNTTLKDGGPLLAPFEDDKGQKYLSIRPIVFGGDDVTFVCDGRIGLWAAQTFLEQFYQTPIQLDDGPQTLHAAVGVAIVKVHYPFARAYELSEQLCKDAKSEMGRDRSTLDWHIAQSGLFGALKEIRAEEYQQLDAPGDDKTKHSLLMRPLLLDDATDHWRTWDNFVQIAQELRNRERWPRNKVLDLRSALIDGAAAVRRFVANYRSRLPLLAYPQLGNTEYRETGWHQTDEEYRAVYFDAIEMIDQLLPQATTAQSAKEAQQ
jgi:hypothetical protein